jgi:hypothetical protein
VASQRNWFLGTIGGGCKKTISIEALMRGQVRFFGDRVIVASLGEVVKSYPWRCPPLLAIRQSD